MREITDIVVHCSATRPEWMRGLGVVAQAAEIRRWHQAQDWHDIGYHWIVGREGDIAQGRVEEIPGAHVRGLNQNSIGVCLIGGHGSEEYDPPERHFTAAQLDRARDLIAEMLTRHPGARISGHNEHAAKACPGFDAPAWWRRVKPASEPAKPSLWARIFSVILAIWRNRKEPDL